MTDPSHVGDPEGARTINRRTLLATGAVSAGALALSGAGTAYARPARRGNTKQIAFAQPDTSAGLYPLLLAGAKSAPSAVATSCSRATPTASSTRRSTSSTRGSARASAA